MGASACVPMVEIDWKHWKIMKKLPFPLYTRKAHEEKRQLLGVTPNCWPTNFFFVFFIFLCVPYVSLSWEWWKRYFLTHFRVFLIVFDYANACASMCLGVGWVSFCCHERSSAKVWKNVIDFTRSFAQRQSQLCDEVNARVTSTGNYSRLEQHFSNIILCIPLKC